MSRSGYSEDYDETFPNAGALYSENVNRAIQGKRGQAFMRDLVLALDALPEKRLISESLVHDGEVCAIGAVGLARGVDMSGVNPDDAARVGKMFGIAEAMAKEVVYQNDEGAPYWLGEETPEARWSRVREWAVSQIKEPT
jgi:hypothetical protein